MICGQIAEAAARHNSKCCVARHRGIEPRRRAVPPRSLGVSGALTCGFRRRRQHHQNNVPRRNSLGNHRGKKLMALPRRVRLTRGRRFHRLLLAARFDLMDYCLRIDELAIASGHFVMNRPQIADRLVRYRVRVSNRRKEAGGPFGIELDPLKAVVAFLSIEGSRHGLDANLVRCTAEQGRAFLSVLFASILQTVLCLWAFTKALPVG